jgi:hypothetical protein
VASSHADTTINSSNKFAWSGNGGWTNFAPSAADGVEVRGRFLSGYAWEANTGWIHFGDGTPDNGYAYSNTGNDHGVNIDAAGNLSGFAWSANTGWVHFGWAEPTNADRPRVDLGTGQMEGYAWSPNTGWMNLGTNILQTDSIQRPDSDGDAIADSYERFHFGTLATADGTSDQDGDGRTDAEEAVAGTDPNDPGDKLRIVAITVQGDPSTTTLEFTSELGRRYSIQESDALDSGNGWNYIGPTAFPPDGDATTTRSLSHSSADQKFFRVEVELPLQQ